MAHSARKNFLHIVIYPPVFLALVALLGGVFALYHALHVQGRRDAPIIINVPRGESATHVMHVLQGTSIIGSRALFRVGLLLKGAGGSLQAGEYKIPPKASILDIIDQMQEGRVILYSITIPEGWGSRRVVQNLNKSPFLKGAISPLPPEGSLLPETYFVSRNTSRMELIKRIQAKHKKLLARLWKERQSDLPFASPYEAVILASIVEKETRLESERRRVAAVFVNRLRKGMRLEADPTIIYGLIKDRAYSEEDWKKPITRSDLRSRTPYNTYVIEGLPPTPIVNPGEKSLEAVLNPEFSEEFYFVADGKGGHRFAKTLEEHEQNVRVWRSAMRKKKTN